MNNYNNLLKHPKWFDKRKTILMRDNEKCQNCGTANNLQVHHRQYHINAKTGRFILPWDYKLQYLVTLCNECHQKGHSIYSIPTFKI